MRFTIGVVLTVIGISLSGAFAGTGSPIAAWCWMLLLIPGGILVGIGLCDIRLVKPSQDGGPPRQHTQWESRWSGGTMPSIGPPG